jgi:LmbE family N-acetylglucosaminyl deacetylase
MHFCDLRLIVSICEVLMRLCVISPHLDDAVFSAHAALSSSGFRSVVVVTVFTTPSTGASSWVGAPGFHRGEQEFSAREQEDYTVLRRLGAEWQHLGACSNDLDIESRLEAAICRERNSYPDGLILIPAAAGRRAPPSFIRQFWCRLIRRPPGAAMHKEHEDVRNVACKILSMQGAKSRWGFYAENPYIWHDNTIELFNRLNSVAGMTLALVQKKPDVMAKLQAAEGYVSQLESILGTRTSYRRKMLAHPEYYFLANTLTLS